MILNDNETRVDLLNNEAIALTIIKLLREHPDKPITVGVHGDWGVGKSSILEMIEGGFEDDKDILCIKFNGWRFQGFEDAKVALIEGIVNGLIEKRPLLNKATGALKETFKRIDWLKVAKKGGGLAWTAFTGAPSPGQIQSIISTVKGWFGSPDKLFTKENMELVTSDLEGLIKPAEAKHVAEEIQEFRKAFNDLLNEAEVKQLIVLVDDLDRCLPDTAIETLEAIRLFVFTERTAFVVAADEAMIEYAVRKHFPELPDTTGPRDYARNYLEKLIQVPFRIPTLGETETRIYVTLLLVGATIGENDKDFQRLIIEARNRLKRPWSSAALDVATIKSILGAKVTDVQDALILSDQIGPILANGTKGNPRQIKRFLNTIVLRQRIAEARGFGDEVKLNILAKLMLAERFISSLFDYVASTAASSPDGKCSDLIYLETSVREKIEFEIKPTPRSNQKGVNSKKDTPDINQKSIVDSWLASESISSWALVEPKLANIDLRPYLFVAKDRKDYFGDTSALGKLAILSERLLGPKIAVQGMLSELKNLSFPDAAQVFEEVRSKIVAKAVFDSKPPGIDGLVSLVAAHSNLESNLLDFLESLPLSDISAWVVSGWGSSISDPKNKARFIHLLEKWATVENNPMLKTAATATLNTYNKTK